MLSKRELITTLIGQKVRLSCSQSGDETIEPYNNDPYFDIIQEIGEDMLRIDRSTQDGSKNITLYMSIDKISIIKAPISGV